MASETKFLIQPPSPLSSSSSSAKMVGQQQSFDDGNGLKVMQQPPPSSSSPYYLCTVTCCDSENCIEHPPTYSANNNNKTKMNKFQHLYEPTPLCQSTTNNNNMLDFGTTGQTSSPLPLLDPSLNEMNQDSHLNCELCINQQQQEKHGKNARILWPHPILADDVGNRNPVVGGGSIMVNNHHYDDLSPIKINEDHPSNTGTSAVTSNFGRNNNKLKLKSLANPVVETRIQSPEMSSSPIGNNSSNTTEYTEIFTPTPVCNSVNSNNHLIIQPLFKINNLDHGSNNSNGKNNNNNNGNDLNPSALDYRLYFMNDAEKHGFFRKAVPTLPLAIAVMFCIMNLILPGSGTFLASVAIIFGSKTEYGPGCGCQAFLICFLSSILQFTTAIFVFGWVWSIMWGIVFIKNSLRYGHERDIHTISLC